jgi:hypothetical protein
MPGGTVMIVLPTLTATTTAMPSPTATPIAVKTVDPGAFTPTPTRTVTPSGAFSVTGITPFCNAAYSGVLEVYVREADGEGVPGVEVEVTWPGGRDRFFTGLKPDEDPGYADFRMEAGVSYQVALPGRSVPSRELEVQPCTPRGDFTADDDEQDDERADVLSGYAVIFER